MIHAGGGPVRRLVRVAGLAGAAFDDIRRVRSSRLESSALTMRKRSVATAMFGRSRGSGRKRERDFVVTVCYSNRSCDALVSLGLGSW